ncbi:MAG: nucleotide exchange factor GrpE [Parcubacteria group bacterium CG11_big_fil_rev_8_21_14_0_20_39_22]|nr:MAG: nucleotide exchange factor GrpE [Parcubacteria group bacterium CG11_big_fil_rev_8_21_14_0_20_39_22]
MDNKDNDKEEADDIVIEEDDSLDDSVISEEYAGDSIKKLRVKLKDSEEKAREYLTGWKRAQADLINARKRDEEEKRNFSRIATEDLISNIIPVLDSFTMAFSDKEAWEKADKNWRIGVEYIHSQLLKVLEDRGLSEVDPLGQEFDPREHESSGHEDVSKIEDNNKIVRVIQKGYKLGEKSIRPARVVVGEHK